MQERQAESCKFFQFFASAGLKPPRPVLSGGVKAQGPAWQLPRRPLVRDDWSGASLTWGEGRARAWAEAVPGGRPAGAAEAGALPPGRAARAGVAAPAAPRAAGAAPGARVSPPVAGRELPGLSPRAGG